MIRYKEIIFGLCTYGDGFMLNDFFEIVERLVTYFTIFDFLDIVIVSFLVYYLIVFIRDTRIHQLMKGILFIFIAYLLASWLKLNTLLYIIDVVINNGILAVIIIFQPELRSFLEHMGRSKLSMASLFGEQEDILNDIAATGTQVDAIPNAGVIANIFFNKAPLHDGAVIIRDARVHSAGCILPLTKNNNISMELGTRHRAAIGMSENSDAVVVVLSEETGQLSIAVKGELRRFETVTEFTSELMQVLLPSSNDDSSKKHIRFLSSVRSKIAGNSSKHQKKD